MTTTHDHGWSIDTAGTDRAGRPILPADVDACPQCGQPLDYSADVAFTNRGQGRHDGRLIFDGYADYCHDAETNGHLWCRVCCTEYSTVGLDLDWS